jgi:hypothetical protein
MTSLELGGHSLLAVQLFGHIATRIGIRLPLVTLFERATIAHLAQSLGDHGEAALGALSLEIPHEPMVSGRIQHPIARYLPAKYRPPMRRIYRPLKYSSLIYDRHSYRIN